MPDNSAQNDHRTLGWFMSVCEAARDAAFKNWANEFRLSALESAESLVAAYQACDKLARSQVDEYVQRTLTPADFEAYQQLKSGFEKVSAALTAPVERMLYWAEKLGLCKANDNVEVVLGAIGRHMIAVHGWNRFQVNHTDCSAIADILKKDAQQSDPKGHSASDYDDRGGVTAGDEPTVAVSRQAWVILKILVNSPTPLLRSDLTGKSDPDEATELLPNDEETIGDYLRELIGERLAERPYGNRKGAVATSAGRQYVASHRTTAIQ